MITTKVISTMPKSKEGFGKSLQAFRTSKINSVIAEIARLAGCLGGDEKRLPPFLWGQSLFAERVGFEPTCNPQILRNLINISIQFLSK